MTKAAYDRNDCIPGNYEKRKAEEINADENQTLEYKPTSNFSKLCDQKELDDLIRDLNLSKNEAKILGFRLEEKNLLKKDVKFSYLNREKD